MNKNSQKFSSISPTAHYTGQVWLRNNLSDKRLSTSLGKLFYYGLAPIMKISMLLGGPTLEQYLLARHRLMNLRLEEIIKSGAVTQIIEIAAGLSPRGLNFSKRFGKKITYIEADLEGMANMKRELLGKSTHTHHQIITLNALKDHGPNSLEELANTLDKNQGLAIITEGLVNYFDRATVLRLWGRIARTLGQFSSGFYLSDIHAANQNSGLLMNACKAALSLFVRSRVHFHFTDATDIQTTLCQMGFEQAVVLDPTDWAPQLTDCRTRGARLVNVIEAKSR